MPGEYRGSRLVSSAIPASTAVDLDALLRRELRLHVGRGRRFSCEQIAEALEVAPRLIKAIRDGEQRVRFGLGLRLLALLGEGPLNRVLLQLGYAAVPLDEDGAEEAAHALLADLGREVASLAEALEDGRIDHRERRRLARELSELVGKVAAVASRMEDGE